MRTLWPLALAILALLASSPSAAFALNYPDKPITLVVAFTPGGPSDVLARIIGKKLQAILGQPFVIENRPGAGGNIAAEFVARAAPDGYTLLLGNNSILATNAALYKKTGFDAQRDFAPIFQVSELDSPYARTPGARFGAHQYHEKADVTLVYAVWFSAGLRIVDFADPLAPREVGHFIPEPVAGLSAPQSNDVTLDARGIIYMVDRLKGFDILEFARG
jgi:hypothetical protein